ncbi:MAG: hypothetical protein A2942_04475 [Candidatus Lloydbacteria bacterium RIFCSPLOWO2_01_FULL_50_20]|uniref:Uncharacterized protein n=1 Tax=Candidatus Lloydbacteria bacterium RIFCSPLOWO2_01_FULL_50_20 TaxID=1798665 RepID=A0A1G2DDE6_9BACT|nr:MAG: hypothetical protein A3C13_03070 [Candidatus Lloydbacteria bacterium RIFCSPHIGHO2_02_FULL_50_11]OGZ11472.1 MAG: hypothetical protein A2942_04475 [Candidatus Lloydbacteria bacterium RIFCSPLOWO2_01_FULL_50_20]
MASPKQRSAAKKNIRKAQQKWRSMTKREHSLAQPEGRRRKLPGTTGKGKFYRIEVRPKGEFATFRNQDLGKSGGLERLAGKRRSGSWDTVSFLVSKKGAHVDKHGHLKIDDPKMRTALKQIRGRVTHVKGDVFRAHPRRNIPENEKPTLAQRRAQRKNIKKAQRARWKK